MSTLDRRRALLVVLLVLAAAFAYQFATRPEPDDGLPKPEARVPAGGAVRVDGRPLVGARVIFLPMDEGGMLTQGETGEGGVYDLMHNGFPGGTAPGRYKVSISYVVTPSGEPVGLAGLGSTMEIPKDMRVFKDRLPDRYSNIDKSELTAVVPLSGGTFDFNLEGPLLPPPEPLAEPAPSGPSPPPTAEPDPAGK
jgi:hypothetical protein